MTSLRRQKSIDHHKDRTQKESKRRQIRQRITYLKWGDVFNLYHKFYKLFKKGSTWSTNKTEISDDEEIDYENCKKNECLFRLAYHIVFDKEEKSYTFDNKFLKKHFKSFKFQSLPT